jgi:sec-independent protein translocase protein TatC
VINELPFTIQSRQMSGQFTMHISSSFIIGLICAFPYAFWEMWRFISPALYNKEKSLTSGAVFFVSLLFIMGILFGYFIVSPLSINFLANYQVDPSILNEFDIISYVSTISMLVLACGLMFQLPIIIYFLSEAGIVTPELMKAYRRHAVVVILIVSAVITPPEVISQILIALPLFILYEISIFISRIVLRRRKKEELQTVEDGR